MGRKAKPSERLKQFGTSTSRAIYKEIKAIALKDPYEKERREPRTVSATTAFFIRVGLGLYRREKKPLYQLMNELEGTDVEKDHDQRAGPDLHPDRGDLPSGAPQTSGARPSASDRRNRAGPTPETKAPVRHRSRSKR